MLAQAGSFRQPGGGDVQRPGRTGLRAAPGGYQPALAAQAALEGDQIRLRGHHLETAALQGRRGTAQADQFLEEFAQILVPARRVPFHAGP